MKIFITHTFKGEQNQAEIEELCQIIRDSGATDYSFIRDVEKYAKKFDSPVDMMRAAKLSIGFCDGLLFDMTDPSVGKAIEAGIAYQLGKKIIVIAKQGTEKRNTVLGIADIVIEYDSIGDIKAPLTDYLLRLKR